MNLERRAPLDSVYDRFDELFESNRVHGTSWSRKGFSQLLDFLDNGERSYQGLAAQAGAKWSSSGQKVALRNAIRRRGFRTPSCLWAYRYLRGGQEPLLKDFGSAEMTFMQVLLLKEADPVKAVPYLIDRFLTNDSISEETRIAGRLCVFRLLDSAGSPDFVRSMQSRFPHSEVLRHWKPEIPGRKLRISLTGKRGSIDFHELLRSVEDTYDLSSLTRILYLASLFSVPLSEQSWSSLFLNLSDRQYFYSLVVAGVIESVNGGFRITGDSAKQYMVKKFLFDSYPLAKQHVTQQQAQRNREARERKVRYTELDRKALEIIPDGIICVDASRRFFYINPAAEKILDRNRQVKEHLFGNGQLDDALKRYSVESVLQAVKLAGMNGDQDTEIFGNRLIIPNGGKRFEVELSPHVILLRDITDQHLIHQEVGKLYRHEARAALDVMGVGLDTTKQLLLQGKTDQALKCLEQVNDKRTGLFSLLEDRIDFIRIHSDAFRIHPSPININFLVEKCVSTYTDAASAKQVSIESNHLQFPGTIVKGEERFLMRALDNIIRNAIKFAPNESRITVKIGRKQDEAFVSITDRGPGIPESNLDRIFDLGFTTNGSGRGLYLSQRIITAHEGRIEVVSKLSQGTCFTVRLPLLKE